MTSRKVLLLVTAALVAGAACVTIQPMLQHCSRKSTETSGEEFFKYIDSISEVRARADAAARGLTTSGSWKDWQSRYDFLNNASAQAILKAPRIYSENAARVVEDVKYDSTQKLVAVILMQRLPIGQYVCFMKSINRAWETGTLKDSRIAAQALLPDTYLEGSSLNYWWHPIWRAEFRRNASRVLTPAQIDRTLSGKFWIENF